jgi:DNA-binding Lrp family transcriptional regulator
VWQESIRSDYIIFTTIFLIATIVIKYFSETSNVKQFCFLINYERGTWDSIFDKLRIIKEIERIDFLAGIYDLDVIVTVRSMQKLEEIAKFISSLPHVTYSEYTTLDRKL